MAKLGPTTIYGSIDVTGIASLKDVTVSSIIAEGLIYLNDSQRVFADDYHPNADKWTTARTLSLTGDATGSVSIDGTANVSINVVVANDSHSHSNYLSNTESGTSNIMNGNIYASDSKPLVQLSTDDAYFGSNTRNNSTLASINNPSWNNGTDHKLFNDIYHPNADKWTTARTLSLTGDATGSVSIDGTANVSISVDVNEAAHAAVADRVDIITSFSGKYPMIVNVNGLLYSHTGVTFEGSSGKITATGFIGALTGNASTATWADTVDVNAENTSSTWYDVVWHSGDSLYSSQASSAVEIQASTGSLRAFGNLEAAKLVVGGDVTRYMSISAEEGSWKFTSDNGVTWDFGARNATWLHNTTTATSGFYYTQAIQSASNITAYSDRRVKTNVERIDDALSKVCRLNGYTFDRTDIECDRQTGVIAQEVLEVLPEAVVESGSDADHYAVAYGNMAGLLIESIKELNEKVERLETPWYKKVYRKLFN
ncbi:long tail fiber protein distal subunit [Vibrio phage D480]